MGNFYDSWCPEHYRDDWLEQWGNQMKAAAEAQKKIDDAMERLEREITEGKFGIVLTPHEENAELLKLIDLS